MRRVDSPVMMINTRDSGSWSSNESSISANCLFGIYFATEKNIVIRAKVRKEVSRSSIKPMRGKPSRRKSEEVEFTPGQNFCNKK